VVGELAKARVDGAAAGTFGRSPAAQDEKARAIALGGGMLRDPIGGQRVVELARPHVRAA
jgi:hypothetical protein